MQLFTVYHLDYPFISLLCCVVFCWFSSGNEWVVLVFAHSTSFCFHSERMNRVLMIILLLFFLVPSPQPTNACIAPPLTLWSSPYSCCVCLCLARSFTCSHGTETRKQRQVWFSWQYILLKTAVFDISSAWFPFRMPSSPSLWCTLLPLELLRATVQMSSHYRLAPEQECISFMYHITKQMIVKLSTDYVKQSGITCAPSQISGHSNMIGTLGCITSPSHY